MGFMFGHVMLHDRSLINPPRMKFEKKNLFFHSLRDWNCRSLMVCTKRGGGERIKGGVIHVFDTCMTHVFDTCMTQTHCPSSSCPLFAPLVSGYVDMLMQAKNQ